MAHERDVLIFRQQVYGVVEPLADQILTGQINIEDARVLCVEGMAAAFGWQADIYTQDETQTMAGAEEISDIWYDTQGNPKPYLSSSEVAKLVGVKPKTVNRWANEGLIDAVKTLGGHRRFLPEDVVALAVQMGILEADELSE